MEASSFEEAKRVKQIALSSYPPSRLLIATFKNGSMTSEVRYVNPSDIPLTIKNKFGYTLYLWSVKGSNR